MTNDNSEATARLRKSLKAGDTIYTTLAHVSSSGMSRVISVHIIRNNKPIDITYSVGLVTGYKMSKSYDGLQIGGCGMDMGFHLVYTLSSILFPKGFRHNKNTHHRNSDTSPRDNDGGYALNQKWL